MLEVLQTCLAEQSVLHGWKQICITNLSIDAATATERLNVLHTSRTEQVGYTELLHGSIEGLDRLNISDW